MTGEICHFGYDREQRRFTLEYEQREAFAAPTVIYLPQEFRAIETDGSYRVEQLPGSPAAKLLLTTAPGTHRVSIQF